MQPVPEGYRPLGFAGFTDKGAYTESEVYAQNDIVHNNNTAWRCLINGTTGIMPEEGANWTVFIASESNSSGITTTDTQGIVGEKGGEVSNQDLIDAIADRVINKLMTKTMMSGIHVNDANKVPTSALAYELQQNIGVLNENISSHDHDSRYYTETEINNLLNGKAGIAHSHAWDTITGKPGTFTPSGHNHDDRYYTESEVNSLLGSKAASSHTHDDRYYTESEVNSLLGSKAASSHTHDNRYYTESEVNNMIWNEVHVKEYSVDNLSVSTGAKTQEFSIALSGYWIVGLVQASIENASSGGVNSSQCSIYGYGTYSQTTAYVRFRAWSDAKVKVIIKVLYWKDPR